MWMILFLMAGAAPDLADAQIAYMRCMSAETDAAIRHNVEPQVFARAVGQLCEDETRTYRAAAIATLINSARGEANFDQNAAQASAETRFTEVDRATRAGMVSRFDTRMRIRRGPSRSSAPIVAADVPKGEQQ